MVTMKEIEINNPFVVGKYLSDKYFCDRVVLLTW